MIQRYIVTGLLLVFNLFLLRSDMQFSELLLKLSRGEQLTAGERQQLEFHAKGMEEVTNLVKSIISPGTKNLTIDGLTAQNAVIESATTGGGDVSLDDRGIFIKNNQEAAFSFETSDGQRYLIYIASGLSDELALVNTVDGGEIILRQVVDGDAGWMRVQEDEDVAGAFELDISAGNTEKPTTLELGVANAIKLFSGGTASGSTYIRLRGGWSGSDEFPTPGNPLNNGGISETNVYVTGGKLVIQYNDGGTVRYKFLDLTGTGVTWVHTTSAP